ncbi:MAG TPA: hypothetical protein VF801_08600 [Rhodocyclaceae bacterium]
MRNQAVESEAEPEQSGTACGGVVRLGPGVTLSDMRVAPSVDGQCLLVYCRDRIVALLCAMGSDVEAFEFANSERIGATDLLDRIAPPPADADIA